MSDRVLPTFTLSWGPTPTTWAFAASAARHCLRLLSAQSTMSALVTVVALSAPVSVAGQARAAREPAKKTAATTTWRPPRTPYGQPDLQGVWVNNSSTPVERPKALEGRQFLTDEEVAELKKRADRLFDEGHSDFAAGDNIFLAALANPERYINPNSTDSSRGMVKKDFDNRTSLITDPPDGKIPPLTPQARRRQTEADAARPRLPEGPEDLNNALRCVTYGVPRVGGRFADPDFGRYAILQAPGYVVLMMESIHDARIVPLDGRPHLPPRLRRWSGDSRGRWEGNTLVVDTTNFSPQSNFMGSAENLHLIERFTRVASDTIAYEFSVDDPTTWTKPWTAAIRLTPTPDQLYEFACHEGNFDTMEGILLGARAEEKAAEGAAKGPK